MQFIFKLFMGGALVTNLSACCFFDSDSACEDSTPPESHYSMSGSISVPDGLSPGAIEVVACFAGSGQCDLNSPYTKTMMVWPSGRTTTYWFDNLVVGRYIVWANRDSNGNRRLDDGDYVGFHSTQGTSPAAVVPPAWDVHITLNPYGADVFPTGSENVKFLRPSDFVGGMATVSLPELGPNESVVVIPVHASQNPSVDGLQYTLSTSGVTAREPASSAWAELMASASMEPRSEPGAASVHAHEVQLDNSTRQANELQQAGVEPLVRSGGVRSQAQAFMKCPPPYTKDVKQCSFWVGLGTQRQISATLRLESANAYWFVQNEDTYDLSPSELDALAREFETKIIPSNRYYFGNYSDVDGNRKLFVVFSRQVSPSALGYVNSVDLYSDASSMPHSGTHSNEGDILYLATPSSNAITPRTHYFNIVMPATMAHELKHQISLSSRLLSGLRAEEPWLEEGSAVAASQLAGLGAESGAIQYHADWSLANPQRMRLVYPMDPADTRERYGMYGYSFLLLWRIAELRGHDQFWRSWLAGPGSGVANLESHARRSLPALMLDWATTLVSDHTGYVAGYDYHGINLRDGSWASLGYGPLGSSVSGTTRSMSYHVGYGTGGRASITLRVTNGADPYMVVLRLPGPYSLASQSAPR